MNGHISVCTAVIMASAASALTTALLNNINILLSLIIIITILPANLTIEEVYN